MTTAHAQEPSASRLPRLDGARTPAQLVRGLMASAPRYTVPAALLSISHQIGEALVPVIMGIAIDRAIATTDPSQLLLWALVLGADFAMLSLSYRFSSRLAQTGEQTLQHRLRMHVISRLMGDEERPTSPGAAVSLAMSDTRRAAAAVRLLVGPVGQLVAIGFAGVLLITISWPVGIMVLAGGPLLLWAIERLGGRLHRRSREQQDAAADAAGTAADLVAGYRVIRGIGAEKTASERYRAASRIALGATLDARRAEGMFSGLTDAATGLIVVAIAVVAAATAVAGGMSVGGFIAAVGLVQFLLSPLQNLARGVGTTWATATASAARLLVVLSTTDDPRRLPPPVHEEPMPAEGTLRIDDVTVGDTALSACVERGEILVVAVDDAAQAAAVAAAFTGDADGVSLGGVPLGRRRRDVLVAPRENDVFAGSIRGNVAVPGATAAAVGAACAAAMCEEFADALAGGLGAEVGERGNRLSGGQRQRVALARAYAAQAPVLVLHDPTSAVDAVTEAAIVERMGRMRRHGYTVVITPSPAFQAIADRVVVLGTGADGASWT